MWCIMLPSSPELHSTRLFPLGWEIPELREIRAARMGETPRGIPVNLEMAAGREHHGQLQEPFPGDGALALVVCVPAQPFSGLFPTPQPPPLRSFAVLPSLPKAEAGAPRSQGTAGVFGKCFHLVALWRNDCLGDARMHPHEPSRDVQRQGFATPLLLSPAPPRLSWGGVGAAPMLAAHPWAHADTRACARAQPAAAGPMLLGDGIATPASPPKSAAGGRKEWKSPQCTVVSTSTL